VCATKPRGVKDKKEKHTSSHLHSPPLIQTFTRMPLHVEYIQALTHAQLNLNFDGAALAPFRSHAEILKGSHTHPSFVRMIW
jgi:hypothetical protein